MRSLNSSLICILGWLKLDLEVVLILIGKFMVKKRKLPISGKSNALHLGIGTPA